MRTPDFIISVLLASLAIAIIAMAGQFPTLAGLSVGPGLFPIVLASALLICAGLLGVQARASRGAMSSAHTEVETTTPHPKAVIRFLAVVAACALFAGLGSVLGFVIVGILSLVILMLAFGVTPMRATTISAVTVILLDLFFVKVMRIPLPLGVLAPLAGWL
jgi:putative tricarboxylic transport membrane protein